MNFRQNQSESGNGQAFFWLQGKEFLGFCSFFALLGLFAQPLYSQSAAQDIRTLTDAMQNYEQIINDLSKTIRNYQESQKHLETIQQSYHQLETDYDSLLKQQEQLANDYKRKQLILGTTLGSVTFLSIVTTLAVALAPKLPLKRGGD